mgnify:CR=1 FL=1
MRIERVIIRGLRALRERDDSFIGLDHKIHTALCLRGLNGSGKTTYLVALAELWEWFRRLTRIGRLVPPNPGSLISHASLVAALITDLPGPHPRRWIAWGDEKMLASLPERDSFSTKSDGSVLAFWATLFERAEQHHGASDRQREAEHQRFRRAHAHQSADTEAQQGR